MTTAASGQDSSACTTPRIPPGSRRDIGWLGALVVGVIGRVTGTGPPNVFTTLARHRRAFLPWLWFAGRLMPGGKLPRADTELVILRVAHNCGSEYEWRHHERIGRAAGLDEAQIQAAREQAGAPALSERQALLVRAADELHSAERVLGDATWDALRARLSEVELIELCLLVGHYEMLAMTLNTLRVQPEESPGLQAGSRLVRAVMRR